MKKSILATLLTAALSLAGAVAHAADTAAVQPIPAALQLAVQGGLKVERSFPAAGGLTGWVLSEGPGHNMVVFTSADGEVAIAGNMVNGKGENLTNQYLDQYGSKLDYSKFWSRIEKSTYVTEGAQGADVTRVIYVFEDANCGYCHLMWQTLQPYEKAGLQVRWIPVTILGQDGANKSAAMLAAKDPAAALAKVHAEFGKPSSFSGTSVTPTTKAKLDANTRLMLDMGFRGTPSTVYKDQHGQVLAVDGMPRPNQFPGITGILLQADSVVK